MNQLPPHDIESEQATLGCILLSPQESLTTCQERFQLLPTIFYDVRHQSLFELITRMFNDRQHIDNVTVFSKVKAENKMAEIGGVEYFNGLPDMAPTGSALPHYLEILMDKFVKRKLLQLGIKTAGLVTEGAQDSETILDTFERESLAIRQSTLPRAEFVDFTAMRRKTMDEYEAAVAGKGHSGLKTGFTDLDKFVGGLRAQDFIVLAGTPSSGKTSLALNIAINAALNQGVQSGLISLETSGYKVVHRLNCIASKANGAKLLNGKPLQEDIDKLIAASKNLSIIGKHVHIYDRGAVNAGQCVAMMRRLYAKGARLFIVDYLQLLDASTKTSNGNERMTLVSKSMKAAAKELDCPLIGISSLNRLSAREGREPSRSDLRETGQLEFDADVIILLHPTSNDSQVRTVNVNVDKNKDGETGKLQLQFFPWCMRFENASLIDNHDVPTRKDLQ